MEDKGKLQNLYYKVVELWKQLCIEHTALLDATFDEYSLLCNSKIDSLEKKIIEKNEIIGKINNLEKMRILLMNEVAEIASLPENKKISTVSDLLSVMSEYENSKKEIKHLEKFNALLIDIITKIQEQNKKNQIFINKAISSLQEIREGVIGKISYPTYNAKGQQI